MVINSTQRISMTFSMSVRLFQKTTFHRRRDFFLSRSLLWSHKSRAWLLKKIAYLSDIARENKYSCTEIEFIAWTLGRRESRSKKDRNKKCRTVSKIIEASPTFRHWCRHRVNRHACDFSTNYHFKAKATRAQKRSFSFARAHAQRPQKWNRKINHKFPTSDRCDKL